MDDDELRNILRDTCWLNGLKNAVEFGGKPNKKAVMGKLMKERPDLRQYGKRINPLLDELIEEISQINIDDQKKEVLKIDPKALDKKKSEKEIKLLPELPNKEKYKKVIMRMAPYPSGALHIGNARMVVLNDEYTKKNDGELILFFDDTIGSPKSLRNTLKAKYVLPEAYELIEDGLKWLGVKYSKIYYKSDRLETFYEYCEKLINDGIAYVCFCDASVFREEHRRPGVPCPHRDESIENNSTEWKNMLDGKYQETKVVVRLKTGMDQKDPALRDQIIMRISEAAHPRVGNKYIVWPMLEFSWAIDDYLIGATHILRGSDLIKEDFIEEFIWDHFGWKKAEFMHYGRIRFKDMKLSKTEARNNIQSSKYEGWNDPRIWSLQSLKNRGIRAEALRETLLDLGMSMAGIQFEEKWLYAKNKALIDSISDRYFFVEDPVSIIIEEVPFEEYIAEPLLLPSDEKRGHRIIKGKVNENKQLRMLVADSDAQKMKVGEILRLKDLGNIQILSVDHQNKEIKGYYHSLELNREYRIIHWVPKEENVKVSILKPDGSISEGFGEINLLKIPMDTVIQFERYGFVNPVKLENGELHCNFTH